MKVKIHTLASSSRANCILLELNGKVISLDIGVAKNAYVQYLIKEGLKPDFGLITHKHLDHVRGAKSTENLYFPGALDFPSRKIIANKWNKLEGLKILPIPSIHDVESYVYVIKCKKEKIVYFTDSEYFENSNFKKPTILFVEANYDAEPVLSPTQVGKHRTKPVNHLTISGAEKFINKYKTSKTRYIQFIHLSSSMKNYDVFEKYCKINSTKSLKYNFYKVEHGLSEKRKIEV